INLKNRLDRDIKIEDTGQSSPSKSGLNFESNFVPHSNRSIQPPKIRIRKDKLSVKPSSGGVYRASITEKKKPPPNKKLKLRSPERLPSVRSILPLTKITYPNAMTNFDPESQNELNDGEQIDYDLRSCNDKEDQESAQITNEDVTSIAYLRNTYNHLHENQFLKLNKLLCDNENEAVKLKRKQRINLRKGLYNDEKSMETEDDCDIDTYASESSFSSENSCDNNEITEITKDMKECQLGSRHENIPAKPIITFTPVRSADDQLNERFHSSRSSERPPSASSRIVEPVIRSFLLLNLLTLGTEMMRPPING
ncbi:hypothetical protein U1Q18_051835, partial [Sarracenia purpurea var. burkii]